MADSFDTYLKWQRELERMADPLGLNEIKRMADPLGLNEIKRMADPLGLNESKRVADPLGLNEISKRLNEPSRLTRVSELTASFDRLVGKPDPEIFHTADRFFGRSGGVLSFHERYDLHRGLFTDRAYADRAYGAARGICDFHEGVSKLVGTPYLDLQKLQDSMNPSMVKLVESTRLLEQQLASAAPRGHMRWLEDLDRSLAPFLELHDAVWPHDALVLRMLDGKADAFGIASWLGDAEEEDAPSFDVAAITREDAGGRPLVVEYEIRCVLCKNEIFVAEAKLDWVGPQPYIQMEVVPICWECTARDRREPGYLQAAMLAYAEGPRRVRPQLVHDDPTVEPTAPTGMGKLTLVRDPDPDDDDRT